MSKRTNIRVILATLLFPVLSSPSLGQEAHENIVHLYCLLDEPIVEGSAFYDEMLFHLDTVNQRWSSSNITNIEAEDTSEAGEEEIQAWEDERDRIDEPYGHTNFIVNYETYILESLLGEIVLNRIDGVVRRLETPNPSIPTFSGKCNVISHTEAIDIYDATINAMKSNSESRTQLF